MIPWEVKVVRPSRRWGNMPEKAQWKKPLARPRSKSKKHVVSCGTTLRCLTI